jgi:CDP-paratose 2-epimerase
LGSNPETNPVDVKIYLSDTEKVKKAFSWAPQYSVQDTVIAIRDWILENENQLRPIFT